MFANLKSHLVLILVTLVLGALAGPVPAEAPLRRAVNILAEEGEGVSVDFHGVVLEGFYDHYLFIRDDSGTVMVLLDPQNTTTHGFMRGDLVAVTGTTRTKGTLRTVVQASSAQLLRRSGDSVLPTRANNVADVHATTRRGDVVSVFGTVSRRYQDIMEIEDDSGGIRVLLGDRYRNRLDLVEGKYVVVIGELDLVADRLKVINAFGATLVEQVPEFAITDDTLKAAKPLNRVLSGVKQGDQITVRGQSMKFIGESNVDFLYDGKNVMIIRLHEGTQANLNAGEEVVVQGTLDFVVHEGKEYPVVSNAHVFRDLKAVPKPKKR